MEETRKRGNEQNDIDSSPAAKRSRPGEESGGGYLGDDIMAWLSMDDDTMTELMNLLDSTTGADSSSSALTKVKFIDNPYTSPVIFQSSASYVTINGNEESCGSSFSDSGSSLMVSVDMGGMASVARELELGAWSGSEVDVLKWVSEKEEVDEGRGGGLLKRGEMHGCDGSDLDDYVLARFLIEEALF